MKKHKIALVGGDGIGPEVVAEGVKVSNEACGGICDVEWNPVEASANRYMKTGETLTEEDLKKIGKNDAIYFGAIGDSRVGKGILERGILLKLRFHFDLYANVRPVKALPNVPIPLAGKKIEDIDMVIVRETTEDTYVGMGKTFEKLKKYQEASGEFKAHLPDYHAKVKYGIEKEREDDVAMQIGILTRKGTERVMKYAYELAKKRRKKITCVTKSNVMQMYEFWDIIFEEVGKKCDGIDREIHFVDAVTQYMVRSPERYDVLVTPNMFGDIITDLGASIQGGMGTAASALINPEGVSMFEPIHGSAPDIARKGIADPIAAIMSAQMMFSHLGEDDVAERIEEAVMSVLKEGKIVPIEFGGKAKTSQIGDAVVKKLKEMK